MRMLDGKVVVVTGGSSGIGRAIALAAARHGAAAVVVGDIRESPREGGHPVVEELRQHGATAHYCETDVARPESVAGLMAAAAELGGVDLMACNAGILIDADGADVAVEDYRRLMSINADGVLYSAQAAAAQMKERQKAGSIVLTSSIGGIRGFGRAVAYSSSKGAVRMMAASLADALGPDGIRVNAVCPGFVATQMMALGPVGEDSASSVFGQNTPLRRLGKPAEIGEAVCWLGSNLASFVTGVSLPVDGGLSSVIY